MSGNKPLSPRVIAALDMGIVTAAVGAVQGPQVCPALFGSHFDTHIVEAAGTGLVVHGTLDGRAGAVASQAVPGSDALLTLDAR